MELNPNHEVTRTLSNKWHVVATAIMQKFDVNEVVITEADVANLSKNPTAISMQELPDGLHIKLLSMDEAEKLAKEHGGSPS